MGSSTFAKIRGAVSSKLTSRKKNKTTSTNSDYRIITYEQPLSVISESYRRIKVSLSFANVDRRIQTIGITSAVQGEGKTLSVLNIASTYVEDRAKVILIDLDLRRPKLHRTMKIRNKDGLADVCSGAIKLDKAIKHSQYGFDVLNAGSKVSYPTALLGSKTMENIFKFLKKKYDIILVDCPPIVPVSDSIIISRLTDGMIFVVSQKIKEKSAAIEGVNILRKNNVKLLGCLFTEVDLGSKSYYSSKYRYYHKYAYEQSKVEASNRETVRPSPYLYTPAVEPAPAAEAAPVAQVAPTATPAVEAAPAPVSTEAVVTEPASVVEETKPAAEKPVTKKPAAKKPAAKKATAKKTSKTASKAK